MTRLKLSLSLIILLSLFPSSSWAGAADAPHKFKRPYLLADFSTVNESVKDLESLKELFVYVRDERFLIWEKMPGFRRRIPWLYTANGCSDRATLARQLIEKKGLPAPTRIFAFAAPGKRLEVQSPYWEKPISWGEYHTALITKVDGKYYVLDPVSEFSRPLLVEEWLSRMSCGKPEEISVVICNPLSSTAERSCYEKDPELANRLVISQLLLEKEWDEAVPVKSEYGTDKNELLGDRPPWEVQP